MAKLPSVQYEWPQAPWGYILIFHQGGAPWEADCLHIVCATDIDPIMMLAEAWQWVMSRADGVAGSAHWASEPLIPRTVCKQCRNRVYGPNLPRYNVYRGETRLIIPTTIDLGYVDYTPIPYPP